MNNPLPEVYLARHGETAWSLSGRHTGRADIPLTDGGEHQARKLRARLAGIDFTEVLVSPLLRARRTCELAGFSAVARLTPDLMEWDYGAYEGRLTFEIRKERPGWYLFRDSCPGGETLDAVSARADRVIDRLRGSGGRILIFGHAHFSRILASRWMGFSPGDASHFMLSTASVSILSYEHTNEDSAILLWNDNHYLHPVPQPAFNAS